MTTAIKGTHSKTLPWGIIASALGVGVFLGVAMTATTTFIESQLGSGDIVLAPPSYGYTSHHLGVLGVDIEERRGELEQELNRARFAEQAHRDALFNLRDDPRWADPEQHDALAGAMRESAALMSENAAAARQAQERLDLLR